jgi:hypothetical protein
MENVKRAKLQSSMVVIPLALVLVVISLALAWHAIFLFDGGQICPGIKFIGLSIVVLGGSFDPINYLWLCLPFAGHEVVVPTRYARFSLPFFYVGLFFFIAGWLAG